MVGNPTVDLVAQTEVVGGSSFYAGTVATRDSRNCLLVGAADERLVRRIRTSLPQAQLALDARQRSTAFRNEATAGGERRQWVLADAGPVRRADFVRADVAIVCPVFGEVSPADLRQVDAGFVGLTLQGCLRTAAADGLVSLRQLGDEWLPHARAVDAAVVSRIEYPFAAAFLDEVVACGGVVAVTLAEGGCIVAQADKTWRMSALPTQVLDETGAGDVYSAALFFALADGDDVSLAVAKATVSGARAVSSVGAAGVISSRQAAEEAADHRALLQLHRISAGNLRTVVPSTS